MLWLWWMCPIMALPHDYTALVTYAEMIHAVYCHLAHQLAVEVAHWFQFSDYERHRDLGFIGLDHDAKEVVVVMAGTGNDHDWYRNAQIVSVPHWLCRGCLVHRGFMRIAQDMGSVRNVIKSLLAQFPDYKLVFTGHSLGGAVVQLFALDFVELHQNVLVVTFASPRVGNAKFAEHMDRVMLTTTNCPSMIANQQLTVGHVLVTHVGDIVPHLPPGYSSTGCQYYITKGPLPHPPESLVRSESVGEVKGQTWSRFWRQQEHQLQMAHTWYFIDILLCIALEE